MNETKEFSLGCLITAILLVLLTIGVAFYYIFVLQFNMAVVNPVVRQSTIHDPNRDISITQAFHTKLGNIISEDKNVLDLLNQEQRYRQYHTNWQHENEYAIIETEFSGVEQGRQGNISDYNQFSSNPDNGFYRHTWLPVSIPEAGLPVDDDAARTYLNNEISQLTAAYNHAA